MTITLPAATTVIPPPLPSQPIPSVSKVGEVQVMNVFIILINKTIDILHIIITVKMINLLRMPKPVTWNVS
jgi:hypothetical protein